MIFIEIQKEISINLSLISHSNYLMRKGNEKFVVYKTFDKSNQFNCFSSIHSFSTSSAVTKLQSVLSDLTEHEAD